jgi:hypothetical protein
MSSDLSTVDLSTVLSVGALSLSLLALGAVVVLYRAAARWQSRCLALEASVPALRRELERLASISARTARPVQIRAPGNSLSQAIESARRGAEPGRLTQQFGLSRAEAELMARMHGRARGEGSINAMTRD